MKALNGIHHISAITADAADNLAFYTGVMGLRLVKKTVNQDNPTVYHLFYADEQGTPGADLTFFEYPGLARGRAGGGMIHRIALRVGSERALDFWGKRLAGAGIDSTREEDRLRFEDPEGLGFELLAEPVADQPLVAWHPEIPEQLALQGFAGVRAFTRRPQASDDFLHEALGFMHRSDAVYESRGDSRGSFYAYDQAPDVRALGGAGTVHHIAWSSSMEDHVEWRRRVIESGGDPTPVIDRFYFRSIYFREPSGVLFEIATVGPGFASDEPQEHLGEKLSLPPAFEHLRAQIEPGLRPLPNPRRPAEARPGAAAS
ncbi:MAG: ring-cleaving dioxygenase [Chloroflexi bacterium]|nr:MAG: ring-cleaving dioxygenase [Chloroflexota bacterium]